MLTFKQFASLFLDEDKSGLRQDNIKHKIVCLYGSQDTLWEKKYIVSCGDEYIGQFIIWKK